MIERKSGGKSNERLDASSLGDASILMRKRKRTKKLEETKRSERTRRKTEDIKSTASLSNETRERLCLRAALAESPDITLHLVLVEEWTNWMHKSLYERDEDKEKKREKE